jgi:integrase
VPVADLPFTYVVRKGGKEYWRFRRKGLHAALPGQPSDSAFHARYGELLALADAKPAEVDRSSVKWLIGQYKTSAEFGALRLPTRTDYEATLDLIAAELGAEPFKLVTRTMVKAVRDDYRKTPRKAHKIKQMVSRLYSWAGESDLDDQDHNPAEKIKRLKVRIKSIVPWSDEEVALFLRHAPEHLKTAVMLALHTGQRAEDVVTMEWPSYQGAFIRVRQSKTGEPLDIACHKALREHLDRIKTRFQGRIARAASGRPYTANSFSKAVYDLGRKIPGWPGNRSPHGLRYAAAGRLEEAGVTPAAAASVLGHRTYQMAMKYLSQRKASAAANARVEQSANEA